MLELLLACAPAIHPVTMSAVIRQESGGNPLAIHDNADGRSYAPRSKEEAVALAKRLVADGRSVDLGLGQINSHNLPRLGMTVDQAFDPCASLRAAERILLEGWERTGNLKGTLSVYNTGKPDSARGEKYAAAVYRQAGMVVPAISIQGGAGEGQGERIPISDAPVRLEVRIAPAASRFAPTAGFAPAAWR